MNPAACSGKIRFDKFKSADRAARRGRRTGERALNAYRCRDCGGYHVGSTDTTGGPRKPPSTRGKSPHIRLALGASEDDDWR